MHYILEVSRYTKIVYVGLNLVLTSIERLFSTVFNCLLQKLMKSVHLTAFSIAIYGKFNSNFPVLF